MGTVSRAKYQSERRAEQAQATRQAILDAARALFVERGYARTTIADIAAEARVAVPTVYVSVGPKPAILGELRKLIPVAAGVPRDTQAALARAADPLEVLAGMAAGLRRLMETSGDLMRAIESAAPFEPVAAEAWDQGLVIHRAAWTKAVERLEALGELKHSLTAARAADVLSTLSLPTTWRTLSQEHGWTYDEIEKWMVEAAIDLVMSPSSSSRATSRRTVRRTGA